MKKNCADPLFLSFPLVIAFGGFQIPCGSTSEIIIFHQIWHHIYSSSTEGKGLSNDTLISVTESIESEICKKLFRSLSKKLRAKCPSTPGLYSLVRSARLDDAFNSREFIN